MKRGNALYNATLGIAGLVVASLALTLSAALLLGPRQDADMTTLKNSKIISCKAVGEREEFSVTQNGDMLEMRTAGLSVYREKLLSSSTIIAQCEGMVMTTYCMGDCADDKGVKYSGIIMGLQYREPEMK